MHYVYKHCGKSHGKERPKKKAFETTSENRRCGCDMLGPDCSKHEQQQQGRPNRRRRTAVYDGHSATMRKGSNSKASSGLEIAPVVVYLSSSARYDGAVPCRHLYTRTASLTRSAPVLSASAVAGGAKWCGHTSTKRTRVARPHSWPTGAVGEGTTLTYGVPARLALP